MKVIIVGASIAGSAAAYLLAKSGLNVSVYEQKKKKDVGKKVCANVVTPMIKELLKELDLDYKKLIKTAYNKALFFSKNNSVSFPTEEYEINRGKFVEKMIRNSAKIGVKFNFETNFKELKEEGNKISIKFGKKNKVIYDSCDILIGADGALSEVAKKAGLWQGRNFLLYLQTKISKKYIRNKKYIPKKNSYAVFLGDKFGYYSYIFSSSRGLIIGLGNRAEKNVKNEFYKFINFLGIDKKKVKLEGAMVPDPRIIKNKKRIILIGDAACQIKFTGGGIIPSLLSAISVREIIIKNDYSKLKKLRKNIFLNRTFGKFFLKFSDKDWESFLDIVKNNKFKELPRNRDTMRIKSIVKVMDIRLFWFILRKFIFF